MKNIIFLIVFLFVSCARDDSFTIVRERNTYDLRIGECEGHVQMGCIFWHDRIVFFPLDVGRKIHFLRSGSLVHSVFGSISSHEMQKSGIYILRKDDSVMYSSSTDLFNRVIKDSVWLDVDGNESSAIQTHSVKEIEYGETYAVK